VTFFNTVDTCGNVLERKCSRGKGPDPGVKKALGSRVAWLFCTHWPQGETARSGLLLSHFAWLGGFSRRPLETAQTQAWAVGRGTLTLLASQILKKIVRGWRPSSNGTRGSGDWTGWQESRGRRVLGCAQVECT
jgi:hypothetical protein